MAEVVAHQPLDLHARFGAGVAEHFRRAFLQLVAENVLVALAFEMQRRSHAEQEVLGVVEARRISRPSPQQQRIGQHRDRARRGQIAKGPRGLLHIGLQLIQRPVERGMPLLDELEQRLQDERVGVGRMEQRGETVEEIAFAGDRPRIEQGEEELGIVGLELPRSRSAREPGVRRRRPGPRGGWSKGPQEPLFRGPDGPAEENEQVDIGVETEMASPVPAQGDDSYRGRHPAAALV